ncbi:MAG TPA: type II toxin-antitoxin system VapC family toxin [Saprospiraceae bacterium]|nr:type II toxin-antitoxin system VapC family toxin [Saprospiraceae bacterium]
MNYLLDTHALIWFVEGDAKLPQRIRALIANPANTIWVSHVSVWEITIKTALSKIQLSLSLPELEQFLATHNFSVLPTRFPHFEELLRLPFHHDDPFDRLLIAQAIAEDFTAVTHDRRFKAYPVKLEFF